MRVAVQPVAGAAAAKEAETQGQFAGVRRVGCYEGAVAVEGAAEGGWEGGVRDGARGGKVGGVEWAKGEE